MSELRRWQTDFEQVASKIPAEWIVRDSDGFEGIDPQHREEKIVTLYAGFLQVGYSKGWI